STQKSRRISRVPADPHSVHPVHPFASRARRLGASCGPRPRLCSQARDGRPNAPESRPYARRANSMTKYVRQTWRGSILPRFLRRVHSVRPRIFFGIDSPIAAGDFGCTAGDLNQLINNFVLAGLGQSERRCIPVRLDIFGELLETAVPVTSPGGSIGIDLFQVLDDGARRGIEAV